MARNGGAMARNGGAMAPTKGAVGAERDGGRSGEPGPAATGVGRP